jgi:MFS family permease
MHPRLALSLGKFLSESHFYLIIFVIAPFLATLFPADQAGLAVSLGAVVTLLAFPLMPKLVARYGARRLSVAFAGVESLILFLLSDAPSPLIAFILVAFTCATSPLIAYQLDLLLQATIAERSVMARIRSAFLTAGNLALILAPLLAGWLLDGGDLYGRVFLAASLSLLPFIVLFLAEPLPELVPPRAHRMRATMKYMLRDPDLRGVAIGNAMLQFFYHLAPLYVPLYLHTALGFPWSDLGWMFAVMLLPFSLLEYPAGYVADRWLGDQEMLFAGFAIMGLAFASLGFVTGSTPLMIVLAILVASRTGAALVESMVESHFFRRVSDEDANVVSIFRMMRPGAALVAPLLASAILAGSSYFALFLSAGLAIALVGCASALIIKDVK